MNYLYCDASALIKRYLAEIGSELVDRLFERTQPLQVQISILGVGEVFAALVRRRNSGQLSRTAFATVQLLMLDELGTTQRVQLHSATDDLVFASVALIERHSINATDALVLRSALDVAEVLRNAGHDLVLAASDARLVRAAAAEGLLTFNPETDEQARLDALIAVG